MKITANQILTKFKEIATQHAMINDYFNGQFFDAMNRDAVDYPLMVTTLQPSTLVNKGVNLVVGIILADKYNEADYRGLKEIHSDMIGVASDIRALFRSWEFVDELDVEENIPIEPFVHRGQDVTAGIALTVTMNILDVEDFCAVPLFEEN